ncbi:8-oxoguanine DNA glycosylase/DNA lyase, thermostable, partial [mine drainage metagenome]
KVKAHSRLEEVLPLVKTHMNSDISVIIKDKAAQFSNFKNSLPEELFSELCFCVLAANTSAELGLKTQNLVGPKNFIFMDEVSLRDLLKSVHYRFYNVRSKFIAENRWIADDLPSILKTADTWELREYLVENLKGIGYKEASHFLRNVGIFDFAILDKHILRILSNGADTPKITSPSKYYELEQTIMQKSVEIGLSPGILDLYLWYIATGKIIK